MSRTTWRGTDDVGRLFLGGLGDFDRLVIRRFDGDDAVPAGIKPDLLGGTAGQVDQRATAHMVIDRHDDRTARLLHGHANPRSQRKVVTGGSHAVLMEDRTAAGAVAFVMGAIPSRHPGFTRIRGGRQTERHGRGDNSWQATLNWHDLSQLLANP
jgi:hypothetical protein